MPAGLSREEWLQAVELALIRQSWTADVEEQQDVSEPAPSSRPPGSSGLPDPQGSAQGRRPEFRSM